MQCPGKGSLYPGRSISYSTLHKDRCYVLRIPQWWEGIVYMWIFTLYSSYVWQLKEQVSASLSSCSCKLWACTQVKCHGMCSGLELSRLPWLEWCPAAPSPLCQDLGAQTWVSMSSSSNWAVCQCLLWSVPQQHSLFCVKGNTLTVVKLNIFFLFQWNPVLEGSWVCVCCFLCDIATK